MKFSKDFESFLRTHVNLNQERLDRLQDRVAAIENFVSSADEFEAAFQDLVPAGSWAQRTIIRPVQATDEFDADVLLRMDEIDGWLPKAYVEELWAAFRTSGTYKKIATRRTRCVRIDYAGDFHIDIVPYLERVGRTHVTNRLEPKETGRYEPSNTEEFTEWVDERDRLANGTFVKVIRLVKYLRDFKNTFTCKSIILTTLVGNQVEGEVDYPDVPTAFVLLMEALADSLPEDMPDVIDPAGSGDSFSERYGSDWNYTNFRTQIQHYAEKARAAFDESDRNTAIGLWQEIFGTGFKPGALKATASLAPLSSAVPTKGEDFIDSPPFNFSVRLDRRVKLKVTGRVTGFRTSSSRTLTRGVRTYSLPARGNRVSKNRSLRFEAKTNARQPYTLYWKVRNGGEEAQAAGEMRGEITEGNRQGWKDETTLYRGSHYVECYVVKNGTVIAKDKQRVIVE